MSEDARPPRLSFMDRWLTLWIFAAMAGGILLGWVFPALPVALDAMTVGTTNLPIANGLILMDAPPIAGAEDIEKPGGGVGVDGA